MSGWITCSLRLTWHPGGTVIVAELLIAMVVKVEGHLIVVEKSIVEEMIHMLLAS